MASLTIGLAALSLTAVSGAFPVQWDFHASGAFDVTEAAVDAKGTIYIGADDSKVRAIHSDGTLKWEFATNSSVYSPPKLSPDESLLVFGSDDFGG